MPPNSPSNSYDFGQSSNKNIGFSLQTQPVFHQMLAPKMRGPCFTPAIQILVFHFSLHSLQPHHMHQPEKADVAGSTNFSFPITSCLFISTRCMNIHVIIAVWGTLHRIAHTPPTPNTLTQIPSSLQPQTLIWHSTTISKALIRA